MASTPDHPPGDRRPDRLTCRPARPDDEQQVLALAQRTLGWGPEPRWADLFRWKHDLNAFGPSPRWVAEEDGVVVGFRVFLRWEFIDRAGRVHRAVRAVDTATDPRHQGRGIFTRLTRAALTDLEADGIDFVFNTPNDQSRPGYLKMGWEVVGRPPIMTVPTGPLAAVRLARARTPADLWSQDCSAGLPAPEVLATEAAEELATAAERHAELTTRRTIDFLRWRYGLADLRYRALTLGADPTEGVAVFRLRRRGPAHEATVTELLVPAGPDAGRRRRRLLRLVARRSGADFVLVGHDRALLGAPALPAPGLGPILTWRQVAAGSRRPDLAGWQLGMGDLELF